MAAPLFPNGLPKGFPPVTRRLSIPGFSLGHGSDTSGLTGVTVVLCPEGATAAAEVRGSATGTRQFDPLVDPRHVSPFAHAVVLSGGSSFGLSTSDPVVRRLAAAGTGFPTPFGPVPLVPTAILFDLGLGDPAARPGDDLVERALAEAEPGSEGGADREVPVGSVGAGTGATVGKALGPERGMKGGFGFASLTVPGGPTVAAAVAVNAFGDVRDPETGALVAGCRTAPDSREQAGAERVLAALPPDFQPRFDPRGTNTTLAVVMTDAELTRVTASKVCQMAFGGFYRALAPAISLFDGDLVVTLSLGGKQAHPNQVGVLAARAVERAIVTAVTEADGFGLLPAVRDL
jgi:L-aminopeptidase/D-esterase-like protein